MTFPLRPLWLCADAGACAPEALVTRVSAALSAAPATVWLRSPHGHSAAPLLALAHALRDVTARAACPLVVGDRVDVAVCCEADAVHLPERALRPAHVHHLAPSLRVSVAVHDATGVTRATEANALVVSPFGAVEGKNAPLGRDGLAALVARAASKPVIALGGITTVDDVRAAVQAGARGVAVRRALLDGDDPARACATLAAALDAAGLTATAHW